MTYFENAPVSRLRSRSFYKQIVNVHNYSGVIGKLLTKKKLMADLHLIEKSNFVWDAKTLFRTLDKINKSRPIIKIFLFAYTESTKHIFSSNFANFFFYPHMKMLDMPKWFSDSESLNSIVSINISGAKKKKRKKKKNFPKD